MLRSILYKNFFVLNTRVQVQASDAISLPFGNLTAKKKKKPCHEMIKRLPRRPEETRRRRAD